jgi:DNA-binding MarR family transcriptional regulator
VPSEEVDAVLAACRVLVAISARSIAKVGTAVDATQLRALVVVASNEGMSLGNLAAAAGLSLSTASRLCDRLVAGGLVNRADDPANRRQLALTLTDAGSRVVRQVTDNRRQALEPILRKLPRQRRAALVAALKEFTAASGEAAEQDLWSLGWATEDRPGSATPKRTRPRGRN